MLHNFSGRKEDDKGEKKKPMRVRMLHPSSGRTPATSHPTPAADSTTPATTTSSSSSTTTPAKPEDK